MHESTVAFLEAMAARNATSSAYTREAEDRLLRLLADGLRECFDLQLLYDRVELDDPESAKTLGEYRGKTLSFLRVGQELRAKIQELAKIRREIEEVEARVGVPMLAGELPHVPAALQAANATRSRLLPPPAPEA